MYLILFQVFQTSVLQKCLDLSNSIIKVHIRQRSIHTDWSAGEYMVGLQQKVQQPDSGSDVIKLLLFQRVDMHAVNALKQNRGVSRHTDTH